MTNDLFKKIYGDFEFREMCKYLPQDLKLEKINGNIGYYKLNKKKKEVIFYRKNKEDIILDYATIFVLLKKKIIKEYIERR